MCAALLSFAAAVADPAPTRYAEEDYGRVDKIDTHVHLYGDVPLFMARAQADGFRLLTINVNYSDFPSLDEQRRSAVALRKAYPGRVAFAATFDAGGSDEPGWAARTMAQLDDALGILGRTLDHDARAACDELVHPGNAVSDFHNTTGWIKSTL